jgi:hypothetical protein
VQQLGEKAGIRSDPSSRTAVATPNVTVTGDPPTGSPDAASLIIYQEGSSVAFEAQGNTSTKRAAGDDFDTAGLAKIPRPAQIGEPFVFNKASLISHLLLPALSSGKISRYANQPTHCDVKVWIDLKTRVQPKLPGENMYYQKNHKLIFNGVELPTIPKLSTPRTRRRAPVPSPRTQRSRPLERDGYRADEGTSFEDENDSGPSYLPSDSEGTTQDDDGINTSAARGIVGQNKARRGRMEVCSSVGGRSREAQHPVESRTRAVHRTRIRLRPYNLRPSTV